MYDEIYALLGIERHRFRLSRRDVADVRGKYVDDDAAWAWAEELLRDVLERRGCDYVDGPGHAAFYGPKIDVQVATAGGGEETLSTVQVDFVQPARLGLEYTAPDGRPATPVCLHRAPFSTHERFVALLTELYAGAFPTWLAPVQALVVPVSDAVREYAGGVVRRLRSGLIRAELASAAGTVARNVRDAAVRKIPNVVVVGQREAAAGRATLRRRGDARRVELSVDALERTLARAIAGRERTVRVDE
jgi:threonyl-tRNA synthetase